MTIAAEFVREIVGYVAVGPHVWRVRRVNSDLLRREGHAHLEGSEAFRAVQARIKQERTERLVARGEYESEEARRAAVERVAQVERERAQQRLEALLATEESRAALLARCDAYLCASIDACAVLVDPVAEPVRFDGPPPVQGTWEPWAWVRSEEDHDPSAGRVHVGFWPSSTRQLVGLAVQGLQEGLTRRRVEPFPPGSGAAAPRVPAGAVVRDDAVAGAAVEPGGAGDQSGGARAASA